MENYYGILNRLVWLFNLKYSGSSDYSHPRRTQNAVLKLFKKHRTFKIVVNPMLWLLVSTGKTVDKKVSKEFIETLTRLKIPFMAIMNDEGLWFADLSKKYSLIISQAGLLYDAVRSPFTIETFVKGELLMYNYHIFGNKLFELQRTIEINNRFLEKLPPMFEYILELSKIRIYTSSLNGEPMSVFYIEIEPSGFVFDGAFLVHRNLDSGDNLTISFLKEIAIINEQINKVFNKSVIIQPDRGRIYYKTQLLDIIESQVILPECLKLGYTKYQPAIGNKNIDLRLKIIKKVLFDLEQRKT